MLHALASALLDYEILDGEQIAKILKGEKLIPKKENKDSGEKKRTVKRKTKPASTSKTGEEL